MSAEHAESSLSKDLFLSSEERYEVWMVKWAERPELLEIHHQGNDDDPQSVDPPLMDGCDIPAWRQHRLATTPWEECGDVAASNDGEAQLQVAASWSETIVETVGAGCPMLRRETSLPILPLPTQTKTSKLNSNTLWTRLRDELLQEPPAKHPYWRQRYGYQQVQSSLYPVFERDNVPAIIDGCTVNWNAMESCQFDALVARYGHLHWRFSDTHGESMSLRTYQKYISSPEGQLDDAPLAVYDSQFHEDERAALLDEYTVPSCFDTDLFACLEGPPPLEGDEEASSSTSDSSSTDTVQRPPYRWILIGPERSGTGLHVDPVGTHAWVTLVQGCKRWILFPPDTDRAQIHMQDPQIPSSIWFAHHYRTVAKHVERMVEIVQRPGETVYVPAGWPHLVLNLELSVAITHNYATQYPSMPRLWKAILQAEPELAECFRDKLLVQCPDLALQLPE